MGIHTNANLSKEKNCGGFLVKSVNDTEFYIKWMRLLGRIKVTGNRFSFHGFSFCREKWALKDNAKNK